MPVKYPGCEVIGVRVVYPANPKAPAENLGMVMFFVPPHVMLEPGGHHTEECYVIMHGEGTMMIADKKDPVKAGRLSIFHRGASMVLRILVMRHWRYSSVHHHRVCSV